MKFKDLVNLQPAFENSGASNEEIMQLESVIAPLKLPPDYVAFLKVFNGAQPVGWITIEFGRESTNLQMLWGTGNSVPSHSRCEDNLDLRPEDMPKSEVDPEIRARS